MENNTTYRKKTRIVKILERIIPVLIVVLLIVFFAFLFLNTQKDKISIKDIRNEWKNYNYSKVYELSKSYLQEKPFNNTALTYFSYSCFFLAQEQTDTQQTQSYLDECINNLRIALYESKKNLTPQLQYMLGRAYFYKNTITNYYYADLAIKYLLLAKENGYESDDIAEYLGLSYASLGMTMESISAFTEALLVRESDSLLLSIAEQYYKIEEYAAAKQYLYRIINKSVNDDIIIKSEILLGNIYIDEENYEEALLEFEKVLNKKENSADAHYGIGIIYEKQKNIVKARSEWRKALKLQVNHSGALQKLSEN